ncbi:MAG TPA: glycine--tRNA ligase [Candidatus Saccharimonadales bacterium]|nr:glycine--tRNA ligase [Candidatus Saccharimonadales bacterium]
MANNEVTLETLTSLAKRRGFVFQASEIYGGLAGFWDYGPYGVELVNNLKQYWWQKFVREQPNVYGIDGAIIQNTKLWKASGHIDGFNDPLVEDTVTRKRYRADHLAGVDTNDIKKLNELLKGKKSPDGNPLGEVRTFNMMFKTYVGALEDEDSVVYLRPETAGAIFTNYELVRDTTRSKVPFGVAQIGKGFRNEISPREFLFRVREFDMLEMEYFTRPSLAEADFKRWKEFCWNFLLEIGVSKDKMVWYQHKDDERAHYAADSWDIQYKFFGGDPKELWGIANRTDFDLKAHSKASGKDLSYFDPESNERFTPYVVEPAIGLGRMFLSVLDSAYTEEKVGNETRIVLKFKPEIAPVKVAVLPLSKKPDLSSLSEKVYKEIVQKTGWNIEYDETQSIGKRYRRQDEIGTPYCVTIDFESLEDGQVTIRERDSMKQTRVAIADVINHLKPS